MSIYIEIETELGTIVCDEQIGEGGSSIVYKCHLKNDEKKIWAVKILKKSDERFGREIDFQKKRHTNIVHCITSGTYDGKEYYVMPYYKETLRSVIEGNHTDCQKIKLFLELCKAVRCAHSKDVVHRDIKPENIMVSNSKLLLGDFGIAHFPDSTMTKKDNKLANFAYHAPEQNKKSSMEIGKWTDIYALGLILNELFTKSLPIGVNPKKIGDVSPSFAFLDNIVDRMLDNDIKNRENDINVIIKMIEDGYNNQIKKYNKWIKDDKRPKHMSKDIFSEMKRHAFEDTCLVDILLNNDDTDWEKIDTRYHLNLHCSASKLIDTIVLLQIYDNVNDKLEYESNVGYYDSQQPYKHMDWDGKDSKIYEKFKKIIMGLKTIDGDDGLSFDDVKKMCLKLFQSLSCYHGEEIIKQIDQIIDSCTMKLDDSQLMLIAYEISRYVPRIKDTLCENNFEVRKWIDFKWNRSNSEYVYDDIHRRDMTAKQEKIECCVIDKLKSLFPGIKITLTGGKYHLVFSNILWKKFNKIIESVDDTIKIKDLFTDQYVDDEGCIHVNATIDVFCMSLPKLLKITDYDMSFYK